MSQISGTLDSLIAKNQSAAYAQTVAAATGQTENSDESSGSGFGSAVNLTLSPAAQAAVAAASSSSGSGASSAGGPPGGGGAPPIPISSSTSSSSDVELLIEEAKQQVIPQVGITGADEVVDDKGNIDEVKLSELIAQQLTATPSSVNITA